MGGSKAPYWFDFLEAASDFGVTPDKIEDMEWHWFEKWRAWRIARNNRETIEMERERAKWQAPKL